MRKSTDWLVVHCSATRAALDVGAAEIRRWHTDAPKWVVRSGKKTNIGGRGWSDIGYHYVIKRDGTIQPGRKQNAVGAHVENHNANSIGICLVGGLNNDNFKPENNFTKQQFASLKMLLSDVLLVMYPEAKILGHRDFPSVNKACPCFDAIAWAKQNGLPGKAYK